MSQSSCSAENEENSEQGELVEHDRERGDTPASAREEHRDFVETALNSLPLVTTYFFEVKPARAKEWCAMQNDFYDIIRRLEGASGVFCLQRCPFEAQDPEVSDCENIQKQQGRKSNVTENDEHQQKQDAGEVGSATKEDEDNAKKEDDDNAENEDGKNAKKEDDENVKKEDAANASKEDGQNAAADHGEMSAWPLRDHTPYHNFLGFGTYPNMTCFEKAFSNEHSVRLLEAHLKKNLVASFFILQMWYKYNNNTDNPVTVSTGAEKSNPDGVNDERSDDRKMNRRAGNFFMMRTSTLKTGASREIALQFLSRIADLTMQKEIKDPAVKSSPSTGENDEAATVDADRHYCVFYDVLVSNNEHEYQKLVELVSWTSKEAYEIQKSISSTQEQYDALAKMSFERQIDSFWERNDELLPEPM